MNLGIVGLGRMGLTHYAIVNTHPDVNIQAVSETSSLLLDLGSKFVGSLQLFKDYHEMLDAVRLDAIIVSTPPSLHFDIARVAGNRGIHMFCEKPFTTSWSSAVELAELYEAKSLVNQIGYVNRFNRVFQTAKKYIEGGVIGNLNAFRSMMYSSTVLKRGSDTSWRATRQQGGGALYEMASHAIDLINYIVGRPDRVVGSFLKKIYSTEVEDAVVATFLYRSGIIGMLDVNWSDPSYRKPTNRIELHGSMGKIIADQHTLRIYLTEENRTYKLRVGWNTLSITDLFSPVRFYVRGNEFTAQLDHFIDCVLGRRSPEGCSFRQGAETLKLIEEVLADYERNILR